MNCTAIYHQANVRSLRPNIHLIGDVKIGKYTVTHKGGIDRLDRIIDSTKGVIPDS